MNFFVYHLEREGRHIGLEFRGNYFTDRQGGTPHSSQLRSAFSLTTDNARATNWRSLEASIDECFRSLGVPQEGREYHVPVDGGTIFLLSRNGAFETAEKVKAELKSAAKEIAVKYGLDTANLADGGGGANRERDFANC